MTDDADYEDEPQPESPRGLRKQLAEALEAKRIAEERAARNELAAKRVAFQDAGIPDNKQTKFFREHYSGDMTAEAIATAAAEYGFLPEQSQEAAAEINEIEEQARAAQEADPGLSIGSDAEMYQEMDKAARNAPRGGEAKAIAEVRAKYMKSAI